MMPPFTLASPRSLLLLLALTVSLSAGLNPCDEAYGAHCPEEVGWRVGDCLKAQADAHLSSDCLVYINAHDACRTEMEAHCLGKEYSGDAVICLAEWTAQDLLSESCKDALPKKTVEAKKALTDKEKQKANARRKIRNKAARMARDL
jgi:hypothetical protein